MASPPLVSRATFQRWVVPFAQELIALIHSYGKRVIQHYHGQIREILPDFVTMGADGLHTIEAPPIGNCTLTEAYRLTDERITLIGNIQYDDFRALPPAGMQRLVRDVLSEVGDRRFILSPTAGPFDPDAPAEVIRNYLAFLDAALPPD
jgi:uroporphyrinogen-III decarboxylase